MKKVIITAILAMAAFTFGFAQDKSKEAVSMEQHAQRQTDRLGHMLQLSADQKKQISQINLEFMRKMEANRRDRTAMEAAHKEKEEQLRAVLTKEQRAKFDDLRSGKAKK
jgi:protein CpxP